MTPDSEQPAKECEGCGELFPGDWINSDGLCPDCEAREQTEDGDEELQPA